MKTIVSSVALYSLSLACLHAVTIAQWDFNSPVADGDSSTGTNAPSIGRGTATLVGNVSAVFAAGDTKHDPAGSTDNSGWNTKSYPSARSNNLSAGVRFTVDTTGYENISVDWYQQNSASASRYSRFQYTTNGTSFLSGNVITIPTNSVFTNRSVSLAAVSGVRNNPSFGFQLVTEFESTATGSGASAYAATGTNSNYSTAGTIRFDMVTISGTVIAGANTAPNISSLADQKLHINQSSGLLPFTIWDAEDAPASLTLNRVSSNPSVVPVSNIVLGRNGSNCTATVTSGTATGSSSITLWVVDTGGRSNSAVFTVDVFPANTPPSISLLPCTSTLMNTATPALAFTVGDWESAAAGLTVSGSSANSALVPNGASGFSFGGSGSNRTVVVTPAAGQMGVAPISLTVSDGALTGSSAFPLLVVPSTNVLLCDFFSYADGPLLTNSAFLWTNRSGTLGECSVTNGQVLLTASRSEDVHVSLPGAPYTKDNGTVLYASLVFKFLSLPKLVPTYFAGLANGSTVRGRVYAGTTNSSSGCFSLFVSTASDTNMNLLAANLSTNTTYIVVTKYDVDAAATTAWLNPVNEASPGANSPDTQSVTTISSYALREASELGGALLLDELRVGLSFDSVLPASSASGLSIQSSGQKVVLRWKNSSWLLQGAPSVSGPFTNIPGATSPFTNPVVSPAGFFRVQ